MTKTITKIIQHADHYALLELCPYGGSPTLLGATTWIRGTGPTYIEGGKESALLAIKEKQTLGYMPSFC